MDAALNLLPLASTFDITIIKIATGSADTGIVSKAEMTTEL